MRTILDISPTLSSRLAMWPGDLPFRREVELRIEEGAPVELSSMHSTLHAGAHADAPRHVLADAEGMDKVDLDAYLGPCEVIEILLPPHSVILPNHLPAQIRAPRVLFKTCSEFNAEVFSEDFTALSPEVVKHLKDRGCVLLGIDTPSIDPFASSQFPSHRALFEGGMRCLEGLDLSRVEPGLYTLVALPLKIEGGDGSPVRAVLISDSL